MTTEEIIDAFVEAGKEMFDELAMQTSGEYTPGMIKWLDAMRGAFIRPVDLNDPEVQATIQRIVEKMTTP